MLGSQRTKIAGLALASLTIIGWQAIAQDRAASIGSGPPAILDFADTVLINGKILTVDANNSVVEAMAVRDGRVLATGSKPDVLRLAGPSTTRIDLAGKSVVPGFIDSDGDNAFAGGDLYKDTMINGVVGKKIKGNTVGDLMAQAKKMIATAKPGSDIFLRMSDEFIGELAKLTKADLDKLSPNNPLMMSLGSSDGVVNTAMLNKAFAAGLPRDHFQVVKDASGNPTGQLFSQAIGFIGWNLRDWPELTPAIFAEQKAINADFQKVGVTTVTGHASGYTLTIMNQLFHKGELSLRIRPDVDFGRQNARADQAIRRTPNMVDFALGDGVLRVVGAAVGPVDGGSDAGAILTNEPKANVDPEVGGGPYGRNKWTGTEWTGKQWADLTEQEKKDTERETLLMLRRHGWNIGGNHNMGSGAAKIIMETLLEAEQQGNIKVHDMLARNALDHNLIWDAETIELAKRLGDTMAFGLNSEIWNQRTVRGREMLYPQYGERLHTMQPVKDLLAAGLNVHFEGGDPDEPPLWRVERFVTRTDIHGRVWGADQAISREQALRMVTYNAAKFISEEDMLGSLEAGKYADFIVLDGDYTAVSEDQIDELKPAMTFAGGKVVYQAG